MAKKEILTFHQKQFLDFISGEKYVTNNFYLTGGTALSAFYLHHRVSEDLDFFNEKEEINLAIIDRILGKFKGREELFKIENRSAFGLHNFFLHFKDKDILKVDFSYYPHPRILKGIRFGNIVIDSDYDIGVNKIHTIGMQPRARDFIDVYFLIKEKGYSLQDLISKSVAKFDWHIDPIELGSRFLQAANVKDFPLMLKKIDHKEWQDFFTTSAKKLGNKIFK